MSKRSSHISIAIPTKRLEKLARFFTVGDIVTIDVLKLVGAQKYQISVLGHKLIAGYSGALKAGDTISALVHAAMPVVVLKLISVGDSMQRRMQFCEHTISASEDIVALEPYKGELYEKVLSLLDTVKRHSKKAGHRSLVGNITQIIRTELIYESVSFFSLLPFTAKRQKIEKKTRQELQQCCANMREHFGGLYKAIDHLYSDALVESRTVLDACMFLLNVERFINDTERSGKDYWYCQIPFSFDQRIITAEVIIKQEEDTCLLWCYMVPSSLDCIYIKLSCADKTGMIEAPLVNSIDAEGQQLYRVVKEALIAAEWSLREPERAYQVFRKELVRTPLNLRQPREFTLVA